MNSVSRLWAFWRSPRVAVNIAMAFGHPLHPLLPGEGVGLGGIAGAGNDAHGLGQFADGLLCIVTK